MVVSYQQILSCIFCTINEPFVFIKSKLVCQLASFQFHTGIVYFKNLNNNTRSKDVSTLILSGVLKNGRRFGLVPSLGR